MIRQIWYLIRNRKQTGAETTTEPATGPAKQYQFEKTFEWGKFELQLDVEQGVIQEAVVASNMDSKELADLIGGYLTGRKYERKEVLKILDTIPVNNEQENAIMRDVYNLLDAQIFQ